MSEFASTDPRTDLLGHNREAGSSNDEPNDASSMWLVAGDDPSVVWKGFIEVLDRTENPRRRQILETIIQHLRTRPVVTWRV